VGSDRSWRDYQRALLDQGPPGYPPCVRRELTVVCKRTLIGDVLTVEVESSQPDAHEFVARFRATSY
jgi:hypothetical protein